VDDWSDSQRIVPHSLDAEVCVLGAIILSQGRRIGEARDLISEDDFYRPAHQEIWKALCWMADQHLAVDLVTFRDALVKHHRLEAVGGIEYVADLVQGVPSAANIAHYARIVREKSVLRSAIVAGQEIVRDAYECLDAGEMVSDASGRFFELGQRLVGEGRSMDVGAAADLVIERSARARETGEVPGIQTGISVFDATVGGLRANHLIVLAGRTSLGKSAMALCNWSRTVLEAGGWVVYVSVEMPSDDLTGRLMASWAGVSLRKIEDGLLAEGTWGWEALLEAQHVVREWRERLRIIGRPVPPSHAAVWCRAMQQRWPGSPGLLVYDYIQRIPKSHPRQTQYECVSEGSTALKNIALDMGIPVVGVAQFNRGPEADNRLPRRADLKASGDIEQDADVVFLLGDPKTPETGPSPLSGGDPDGIPWSEVWGRVAKARRGPPTNWSHRDNYSDIRLKFLAEVTRFEAFDE
jgi:replicative DNA helicase